MKMFLYNYMQEKSWKKIRQKKMIVNFQLYPEIE